MYIGSRVRGFLGLNQSPEVGHIYDSRAGDVHFRNENIFSLGYLREIFVRPTLANSTLISYGHNNRSIIEKCRFLELIQIEVSPVMSEMNH